MSDQQFPECAPNRSRPRRSDAEVATALSGGSSLDMGSGVSIQSPPSPRPTGWLRHGNPPGDLRLARRCGAKARSGCACRQPAMANGRCRFHGGKSTGPKTVLGRERSRLSQYRHGLRGRDFVVMRREGMRIRRNLRALCAAMRARIALQDNRPMPRGYARWVEGLSRNAWARPDPEVTALCLAPMAEFIAAAAARAADLSSRLGSSVDMGSGVGIQTPPPPRVQLPWNERRMGKVIRDTLARVRPRYRQPVLAATGWAPAAGLARAA